jgi:hypothetical protein
VTETSSTPKHGRRLAGVIAGALVLGIVPFAFPASSQTDAEAVLRDIRVNACPVDDVPEDGFTDIAEGALFEFEVDCVAWYNVTSGATETTYNPLGNVSRGQMATFIANLIDYVDDGALDAVDDDTDAFPCESDPDEFADATHLANVQRLADAKIVRGGPAGLPLDCYGPSLRVSREQMASFINQAQTFLGEEIEPAEVAAMQVGDTTTTLPDVTTTIPDVTTTIPDVTTTIPDVTTTIPDVTTTIPDVTTTTVPAGPTFDNFFDDDDDSVHHTNINAIASEGIVIGTSDRTYSPERDITRQQMAAFLARKLDYLIEVGKTNPPATTTTTSAP